MPKIKISVILPVYNVEGYIERCIESLQAQTFSELEFIFIDDCSTDSSMKPAEAWAAKDERVRILSNDENIGAGPSRNRGIEAAQGEYLSFVDPDDYVASDFYKLLYEAATKDGGHDIAKGVRKTVGEIGDQTQDESAPLNEIICSRLASGKPLYATFIREHQAAIYRRELFADSNIRYGTSCCAQDTTFLLRCSSQTEDIVIEESAIYFYVQRDGSAIYGDGMRRTNGELDALAEKADFLRCMGIDDAALDYFSFQAFFCLRRFQHLLGEERVNREDYKKVVARLAEIIREIPDAEEICKEYPQLKEVLSSCPLTTPGKRSPGEGDIRVSVILPVYNVEEYIGRCIESLRTQLLDGLEFIFVDDCSTDDSMEAVEAWAAEDERVRILRNDENLGAGPSRNRGIEAARGDYLSFVDPDDYISPNFYQLLYAAATEGAGYDIAKGGCKRVDTSGATIAPISQLNARIAKYQKEGYPLFVSFTYEHWTAIYRKTLFDGKGVRYGMSCNDQDTTFQLAYTLQTNSIVLEDNAFYYYVKRPESAFESASPRRFMGELDALAEKAALLEHRNSDCHARYYLNRKFRILLNRFFSYRLDYPPLADSTSEYMTKLKSTVEVSPALRFLQSENLEYRALVERGAILPSVASLPETQKLEGALTWLDFIRDYNITEAEYIAACADAVATALQQLPDGKRWRRFKESYSQIIKRISTLPAKQRTAIRIKVHHRLASKRNAKAFLRKLKRKCVPRG